MKNLKNIKETNIYVANLRMYNNGDILGDWFTLPISLADILEQIGVDGSESGGEEWIILDHENPYGLPIHEYSDIKKLNGYVEKINELDGAVLDNLNAILNEGYEELSDIIDNDGSNYWFTGAASGEEIAQRYVDDLGGIEQLGQQLLERYFDYDEYGRDLILDGSFFEGDDGNYIMYSR